MTANVQICEAKSVTNNANSANNNNNNNANNNVTSTDLMENTEDTRDTEDTCTDIYKHNRRAAGDAGAGGGARKNTVCCGFKAEVEYMKSQQGASYVRRDVLIGYFRGVNRC